MTDQPADNRHITISEPGKATIKPLEKALFFLVSRFKDTGCQSWRKGQSDHAGDHHSDSNGNGKLFIESASHTTEKGDRQEHRDQDHDHRYQCPGQLLHRLACCLIRRHVIGGHVVLGTLYNNDGIINHQTNSQNHTEQGQHIGRETKHVKTNIGTDNTYRYRQNRNNRSTKTLQEDENDQHHQEDCLKKSIDDFFNGSFSKFAGIEDNIVIQPLGETRSNLLNQSTDIGRGLNSISPGLLVNKDSC